MKRGLVIMLVICAFVVGYTFTRAGATSTAHANQNAQSASPMQQQLLDNLKGFVQASSQKNIDYFKRTLTDDFIYVPQNGGTSERAAFIEDQSTGEKEKPPQLYAIKAIPLDGNTGLLTYDEIAVGDQPRYRHVSQIWVKQAEQWKLKFLQTTPNIWSLRDTD